MAPNQAARVRARRAAPRRDAVSGVGARVREARQQVGLTGADLGKVVGLSKDQVSKIESDQRRIAVTEMPNLAAALHVTPQWLLGMHEAPAMALAHRLAGAASTAKSQERAAAILKVDDLLTAHDAVTAPTASAAGTRVMDHIRNEYAGPPRTRDEANRQGRRMAELVRDALTLGREELGDLPDLIEMHFATDVVLSPLGTDDDGLCAHTADRAVIIASSSFDAGHVRFTVAHELGHHLLADPREVIDEAHVTPVPDGLAERRVSAFAAHLLLPHAGVQAVLDWVRVRDTDFHQGTFKAARAILDIADRFGASIPATVYQLADFGYITDTDRWLDRLEDVSQHHDATSRRHQRTVATVRAPRRLLEGAISTAVDQRTGTGPLAVLLERDDEDALFNEFVADSLPTA